MAISAGDNLVRITNVKRGRQSIYDVFQFELRNLNNDPYPISFLVPAGSLRLPKIIRDLSELHKARLWFTVYLKEFRGMLAIRSIKEPRISQEEINHMNRRIILN